MVLSIIAAVSENGVIGVKNRLPWHLPEDLKRFRAITRGRPIIMGRKTFESIGRVLPDRLNVVVSRNPALRITGARVAGSLQEALELCGEAEEVFIIGGAAIYAEALPLVKRLYLTIVKKTIEGDVYFPRWNIEEFKELSCEERAEPLPHAYYIYERR